VSRISVNLVIVVVVVVVVMCVSHKSEIVVMYVSLIVNLITVGMCVSYKCKPCNSSSSSYVCLT